MTATLPARLVVDLVPSGPARGGQFGACLGDDGRFACTTTGRLPTPVEAPRNKFGATNRNSHDGRQQHEGNEGIDHDSPRLRCMDAM